MRLLLALTLLLFPTLAFYVPTMGVFQLPQTTATPAMSDWVSGTTNVMQALGVQYSGVTVVIRFYYQPGDQGVLLGMSNQPFGVVPSVYSPVVFIFNNVLYVTDISYHPGGGIWRTVTFSLSPGWHTLVFALEYSSSRGFYSISASLNGSASKSAGSTLLLQFFGRSMPYAYVGIGYWYNVGFDYSRPTPFTSGGGWVGYTNQIAWVALYPGYQSSLFRQAWETPPPGYAYLFVPGYFPSATPSTNTPVAVPRLSAFALLPGGLWHTVAQSSTNGYYYGVADTSSIDGYVYSISARLALESSQTVSGSVNLYSGTSGAGSRAVALVFFPSLSGSSYKASFTLSMSSSGSISAGSTAAIYAICRVLTSSGSYDYQSSARTTLSSSASSARAQTQLSISVYGLTVCVANFYYSFSSTAQTTVSASYSVSGVNAFAPASLPDIYGVSLRSPANLTARFGNWALLKTYFGNWAYQIITLNGTQYAVVATASNGSNYLIAPGETHKYLTYTGITTASLPAVARVDAYQLAQSGTPQWYGTWRFQYTFTLGGVCNVSAVSVTVFNVFWPGSNPPPSSVCRSVDSYRTIVGAQNYTVWALLNNGSLVRYTTSIPTQSIVTIIASYYASAALSHSGGMPYYVSTALRFDSPPVATVYLPRGLYAVSPSGVYSNSFQLAPGAVYYVGYRLASWDGRRLYIVVIPGWSVQSPVVSNATALPASPTWPPDLTPLSGFSIRFIPYELAPSVQLSTSPALCRGVLTAACTGYECREFATCTSGFQISSGFYGLVPAGRVVRMNATSLLWFGSLSAVLARSAVSAISVLAPNGSQWHVANSTFYSGSISPLAVSQYVRTIGVGGVLGVPFGSIVSQWWSDGSQFYTRAAGYVDRRVVYISGFSGTPISTSVQFNLPPGSYVVYVSLPTEPTQVWATRIESGGFVPVRIPSVGYYNVTLLAPGYSASKILHLDPALVSQFGEVVIARVTVPGNIYADSPFVPMPPISPVAVQPPSSFTGWLALLAIFAAVYVMFREVSLAAILAGFLSAVFGIVLGNQQLLAAAPALVALGAFMYWRRTSA